MTWADVAAKNAPPLSEQPQPNQDLLEGHFEGETAPSNDSHIAVVESLDEIPAVATASSAPHIPKIERHPAPQPGSETPHVSEVAPKPDVLPSKTKEEISHHTNTSSSKPTSSSTTTNNTSSTSNMSSNYNSSSTNINTSKSAEQRGAEAGRAVDNAAEDAKELADKAAAKAERAGKEVKKDAKDLKNKAAAEIEHAESVIEVYYEKAKDIILRPGTLGGIIGIANVGLLSTLGYYAYQNRNYPWNRNYVGAAVAGTLGLFGAEGLVAEQYSTTPEGKVELERAKREGSRAYIQAKDIVLRPGVAGGLLGVVNVAVLGTVGYFSYLNWNRPVWDKKIVSAVVSGLIGLSAVEGLATNVYQQKTDRL